MKELAINLTETEFERLNALYPPTAKSSNVGDRAEELVRFYFRSLNPECTFEKATDGADLRINDGPQSFEIEVKGTAKNNVAWGQLKVSGNPSHIRLSNGLPLYRVVSVYDRAPRILVLIHDEDFTMEPEARWAVKNRNA